MDVADVQEALTRLRDTISVKRVFGEPFEKDGVTVIPAARIWGGGGGGFGVQDGDAPDAGHGFGSGFGMIGRPAGALVIKEGRVRWQPAVDPNLIVAFFLLFVLLVVRRVRRRRRRAKWMRRKAMLAQQQRVAGPESGPAPGPGPRPGPGPFPPGSEA